MALRSMALAWRESTGEGEMAPSLRFGALPFNSCMLFSAVICAHWHAGVCPSENWREMESFTCNDIDCISGLCKVNCEEACLGFLGSFSCDTTLNGPDIHCTCDVGSMTLVFVLSVVAFVGLCVSVRWYVRVINRALDDTDTSYRRMP